MPPSCQDRCKHRSEQVDLPEFLISDPQILHQDILQYSFLMRTFFPRFELGETLDGWPAGRSLLLNLAAQELVQNLFGLKIETLHSIQFLSGFLSLGTRREFPYFAVQDLEQNFPNDPGPTLKSLLHT